MLKNIVSAAISGLLLVGCCPGPKDLTESEFEDALDDAIPCFEELAGSQPDLDDFDICLISRPSKRPSWWPKDKTPLGVTLPPQPGVPKAKIYIDKKNIEIAIGRYCNAEIAKEMIALVLWHEWRHTPDGGWVGGGCQHGGLHYATATTACERAGELDSIASDPSKTAEEREAARLGKFGACVAYREALDRLSQPEFKNCPTDPAATPGPPGWEIPNLAPPCPSCP